MFYGGVEDPCVHLHSERITLGEGVGGVRVDEGSELAGSY